MAQTVKLKRSDVAAKVPLTTDLALGELAVNTNDGVLYTLMNDGTNKIVQLGGQSVTATVTAGTNAQGQGPLTSNLNVVNTTTTNPSGVTLPTALLGRKVYVYNRGTNPINVYPASGAQIDSVGTNTPIQIPVNGGVEFNALSTTQWYSSLPSTLISPSITSAVLLGTLTAGGGAGTSGQLLSSTGTGVQWTSNVDIPGTLDVTSTATFDSTISFPLGTAALPSIYPGTDTNTGFWSPAADTLAVSNGGTETLRTDSSRRLLVGNIAARTLGGGFTPRLQVEGFNSTGESSLGLSCNSTSANDQSTVGFLRTRGAVGSFTIVNSGDGLGALSFQGADGTAAREAALILAVCDGTPGASDMPGRLVFSTTPDGSATSVEAMRINNQGELLLGVTTRNANGGVLQLKSGITFPATQVASADANTLDDYEEGAFTPVIQGTTTAGTGTYTSRVGAYVKVGRITYVTAEVTWSAHTGTGNLRIAGLPFAAGSDSLGQLAYTNLTVTGAPYLELIDNQLYADALTLPTAGGSRAAVAMDTAATIEFSFCYRASV